MAFSIQWARDEALRLEIERCHIMAKCRDSPNPTFDKEHPDWVADAKNDNFVKMDADIKKKHLKFLKDRELEMKQIGPRK